MNRREDAGWDGETAVEPCDRPRTLAWEDVVMDPDTREAEALERIVRESVSEPDLERVHVTVQRYRQETQGE
jgi:hypothetical protein